MARKPRLHVERISQTAEDDEQLLRTVARVTLLAGEWPNDSALIHAAEPMARFGYVTQIDGTTREVEAIC